MPAWLTAGLAGIVVYLDTTAFGQFMICQPLIACPLYGWLVGRPEIGLFFGIGFQLVWLGSPPIGAAKFPEGNSGALVATAVAASYPVASTGEPAWIVLCVATLAGILTTYFGSQVTPLVRRAMNWIAPRFVAAAVANRVSGFRGWFGAAIGVHAVAGFALAVAGYAMGIGLMNLYLGGFAVTGVNSAVVDATDGLLSGIWPGILGAGAAVVGTRFVLRRSIPLYLSVALGAGGVLWLTGF